MFALEAQEGRLFKPLAFTKTYAMAAAAVLSVTLVPVLMGYLIRGRIPHETAQSAESLADRACYRPALGGAALSRADTRRRRRRSLALTAFPMLSSGGEFMPPLDEGDLLYMPTALPGISAAKATELLQQTDADRDGAGGRERLRQGRTRGHRDRSRAAGDVRDDDPVQAARAVACRA